jgi:DNA-binding beta-propeller fold protein YncE
MALTAALTGASGVVAAPAKDAGGSSGPQREVLVVSNNWDGTADIVDARSFKRLKRINVIPDKDERIAAIEADAPAKLYFDAIRTLIGEGHNQYVDDGFTSRDGRFVYFSRPSFADVVAINIRTGKIAWRVPVGGYRADHMALSPNGRRLLVSASTAKVVTVIDTRRGRKVGEIPSGDAPHEVNFSRDGKLIYHASIGIPYTDTDDISQDETKGVRLFQLIDARTLKVKKSIDMGKELAGYGLNVSAAVRPMALAPDERTVFFQLSFLHGFVEYDLEAMRPVRVAVLPISEKTKKLRRQDYLLDSAHHGLTINNRGTKLCVAGTMSDYAMIVPRKTLNSGRPVAVGEKPYWATTSRDGRLCFVSVSGNDRVSVISFRTGKEVARIPVGDHPQRMRIGTVRRGVTSR